MSLYDALFLYGLAIRDAYDETRNQSIHLNGGLVWRKMASRQFMGEFFLRVPGSTGACFGPRRDVAK